MAGTRGGREAFFDLLADRAQVKCLTGEDGNVHVRGAKQAMIWLGMVMMAMVGGQN